MFGFLQKSREKELDYSAVQDKQRRQAPQTTVKHEEKILTPRKRSKINATSQDQMRNISLVAWMVRKHLDYVSKFHVSFRVAKNQGDTNGIALDNLVNRILNWHGRPQNLDISSRFGRDELFRMFELEKVVCGDAALLKLPDLKLQAIESDLIAKGQQAPEGVPSSGVIVDKYGKPIQYAICNRGDSGIKHVHDRIVPASSVIFDAYWTRFGSQFRGVSPLSTAINTVQDLYEAFEWNLIKAKMMALFGLAIMHDPEGTPEYGGAGGATDETADADDTATDSNLDLNPRAVNIMDMNPGERVQTIESATPSQEFVEGSKLFVRIAMLALDIPYTCFDSNGSSFSGRIADLNEYEVSVDWKRTKNRYVRKAYSDWLIATIWNDENSPWNLRQVAGAAGLGLRDVQESIEWIPSGSPWLDKLKQIQGDKQAIEIGEDNPIDAARRKGQDVFANIDKTARVFEYAKEKGVPLMFGSSGQKSVEEIVADAVKAANEAEKEV